VLDLERAEGRLDENKRPTLILHFTPAGREKFKAITKERSAGAFPNREAIVLDGTLVSAPTIRGEIDSPTAIISGAGGLERFILCFLDSLPADKRAVK
jgi:SecD/SecF fusion protein